MDRWICVAGTSWTPKRPRAPRIHRHLLDGLFADSARRLGIAVLVLLSATLMSPRIASASEQVDALLGHAEEIRSSDPEQLKKILDRLDPAKAGFTRVERERLAYLSAYKDGFEGHFAEAITAANELLRTSTDVVMQFRAGALVVNFYALNGQYGKGLRQLDQTLSLIDQVRDPQVRQLGYSVAATLYNQVGQYGLAQQYAERVASEPASARSLCFANFMKFDAMLHLKTLPSDDQPLIAAIQQCQEHHELVMAGFNRATLARKWAADGQRDRALNLLVQNLPDAIETHYSRLIAEFHAQIAELKLAAGDLEGAEANAKSATEQGTGVLNTPPLVSAYDTLYQVAVHRVQPVVALAYYKQYAEAKMAFLDDIKARELAYHLVRQEAHQKNQQIELLNRQNALLQLQQQVEQQSAQNSRLYMLLFALLAATIGYWAYKTKRMQMSVKHMAETDALTGICNRHHYTLQAEKTLARCKAAGEPVSLLMFDLDYFKSINDSYGHVTGDWVLKRVATVCAELCRGIDHLGRIGGEEFAILLHGYDLKAATRMAEDCRVRLSRIDPLPSGYTFPISASFGVSSTTTSGYELDKLLSHADQVLYRAKREGRNRVRAYVPETSAELTGVNFGKVSQRPTEAEEASPQDSMRA